jgi:CHAT domain-containing protein
MGLRQKLERLARDHTLELACSAGIDCLPWEWLLIRGSPMCLQRPVVRSPVEIRNSARGFRFANSRLRFLIIGDASAGAYSDTNALPGAEREAAELVRQIRSASPHYEITRLSREEATSARFLLLLAENDYDVIHFSGHAWFDAYESYLYFWDGVILGTEIAPLLSRRPPALLVLNTHFTAFRPSGITKRDYTDRIRGGAAHGGAEFEGARGFTSLAMRCGVTSSVGAFGSMADEPAADLMVAFYVALMRGQTVAEALYTARRQMIRKDPLTPLYYTISGYPEFRLVTREPGKKTKILRTKRSPRTRVRHAAL